tara:strand:+ start:77455 stop:78570 length:1116 start_codon:yes stop_codon:yes gene_type:complete
MSAVRFFGPVGNSSGYGVAVKSMALAFSNSKIQTKFSFSDKSMRNCGSFVRQLNNYKGKCNIDFYMHPPSWSKHASSNYKIAYFYWEADRLPTYWSRHMNSVNEIWAPCKLVQSACRKSGFKGEIKVVPTPIITERNFSDVIIPSYFSKNYSINNNVFKFYSIFQWHHRKGPDILLKSYWKEFKKDDNVCLILKTNPLNIKGNGVDSITIQIKKIKKSLSLDYYAPVYLMTDIIDSDKINGLHKYADCYVSPHRGEGWGLPIHDAMHFENHIIVTKFGGITELLNPTNSNIIRHDMSKVSNMDWSPHVYKSFQKWANPSSQHLSALMRDVYDNESKEKYFSKIKSAKTLADSMSVSGVSRKIEKLIYGIKK